MNSYTENKLLKVFMACFMFGILVVMFSMPIGTIGEDLKTKQANCYDEYQNEIIGLQCIDEYYDQNIFGKYLAIIGFVIFIIGLLGVILIIILNRFGGRE